MIVALRVALVLFTATVLQIGLLSDLRIAGVSADLLLALTVAVAVLSGTAATGLGIYAAAAALDLDFIPVVTEQYDLIIPSTHFESNNIQLLLETINSGEFKTRVEALGGYSTKKTGEIILSGPRHLNR